MCHGATENKTDSRKTKNQDEDRGDETKNGNSQNKTVTMPSMSSQNNSNEKSYTTYRIESLPINITVKMLEEHFSQFGRVIDAHIPARCDKKAFNRIGFIVMSEIDAKKLNWKSQVICGRTLKITEDLPSSSVAKGTRTLLVSANSIVMNDISEAELENFFSSFGKIIEVRKIVNRKTKRSSHYAFVEFTSEQMVDRVLGEVTFAYLDDLFLHFECSLQIVVFTTSKAVPYLWPGHEACG